MAWASAHFAKQQLTQRRKAFWRRHWWRVAILFGLVVASGVGLRLLFPTARMPLWMVIPLLFVGFLMFGYELFDGTYHLVNGLNAERWTGKDLASVLGADCRVVDWISFEFHDVDHVVIGPGGVLAVETKYTDSRLDLRSGRGRARVLEWKEQAVDGGRSIRSLLRSFGYRLPVSSAVVVWGPEIAGDDSEDEIPVLRPTQLKLHLLRWSEKQPELSRHQVDDIHAKLLGYRAMREKHELARNKHPCFLEVEHD